jgi:XrtJ-associated TM-motif-TM protein
MIGLSNSRLTEGHALKRELMKLQRLTTLLFVLTMAATVAHAQGGCTDSPENPTAVLGVVGAFAGWAIQRVRARR